MTSGRLLLCLAGPTASGKSAVALTLAARLGGEIVSVDSMQVYRGLDLGTAKPSPAERARVPHHLLDVADLCEPFDAARWCALAKEAVSGIHSRGRCAILCGGTGLYFRALLEGLGAAPAPDVSLRKLLEATPINELLDELAAKDPETFARVDRQNPRRVVRAVEVLRITGRPFSQQRATWQPADGPAAPVRLHVLRREATDLQQRMAARVDAMFAAGLVEETRRLLEAGLGSNPIALQAIGYRQVVEHLRGERDLAATIALVKIRTRQFARRQMTWFKRVPGTHWLDVAADESPETTAGRILAEF